MYLFQNPGLGFAISYMTCKLFHRTSIRVVAERVVGFGSSLHWQFAVGLTRRTSNQKVLCWGVARRMVWITCVSHSLPRSLSLTLSCHFGHHAIMQAHLVESLECDSDCKCTERCNSCVCHMSHVTCQSHRYVGMSPYLIDTSKKEGHLSKP